LREGFLPVAAIPAGARAQAALRAYVDVRAPFVVLALMRRLGRRFVAGLLTTFACGTITLA
jgi:hypothetical protein